MAPPMIHENALDCIGETPLIRLNRIPQLRGIKCNVYAKCEFFNAGGSIKDRVATAMIDTAERDGRLIPGKSVIIEPTSGNTGVGLALAAAVKGYKCIIVLPMKMSTEKVNTMRALGAHVIRTPTEAAHDDPRSNLQVARRLAKETPHAVLLDQFSNPANPATHRLTAEEIIRALANGSVKSRSQLQQQPSMVSKPVSNVKNLTAEQLLPNAAQRPLTPELSSPEGSPPSVHRQVALGSDHPSGSSSSNVLVDALFAGVGTGGTVSGIASRLKEADHNPNCYVVALDPVGSMLAEPAELNVLPKGSTGAYKVEGVGYDFDPQTLNKRVVDQWLKTNDDESFAMTRELIRTEGLLIGGSSGAVVSGAMRWLLNEGWESIGSQEGKNVVVVLADGIRNYVSKEWLVQDSEDVVLPEA
ncbi:pyridoxal phosphate-dependent enzyme, beta subunit [Tilletiaria anomala UBC 951]|uniref:cystathionine beta-synthase n=1 Tax=Tilletiaria anomala (strain ATCC 24038 / CBS 436.72 / UBC 951) TaxID=1037660 RepID=A0A066VJC2_TILAU|nr:pyridoxal phosphate-dependent enzyme, beta subunit [Tilletiaria anomala UBC 951]KDN38705.1 pyridoxal phosphate-dependent enzyme, beta subunit [Tilletiaria anomala UBC 951]